MVENAQKLLLSAKEEHATMVTMVLAPPLLEFRALEMVGSPVLQEAGANRNGTCKIHALCLSFLARMREASGGLAAFV